MSDFKIIGNPDPVVGKEEFYSVNTFLPSVLPFQNSASSNSFEQPVKWEIYILENGRWRKTKENDKTGKRISYTFLQKSLERKGIRILARRGEDVARLNVTTHPAQKPKIENVELLDKSGKKPTAPLSYGQTVKARVHCLHMEKHKVYVTLWEDDAPKGGHNKANEKNIIQTLSGVVKNGKADVDFLLRPSFAKIAKKDGAEDKIHEYYVTTDFNKEKIASNNVNVNDLETPVAPYKAKTTPKEVEKPITPSKKDSPKQDASGAKKEKGRINSVNLTDTAGNKIKGVFKEKQIKVWINSTGLKGKDVSLKLYDEDVASNDLLFQQEFMLKSDLHAIVVPLDTIPRSLGGNFWTEGAEQELFAEVKVLQTNDLKKSTVIDVDAKVFKPDPVEQTNKTAKVGEGDKKEKKGVCVCKESNLIWGSKVSCEFRKKVVEIAKRLGKDPNLLMAGMALETGKTFSPTAGKGTSYVGLIQFGDSAASSVGTTTSALLEMTALEQLDYVEKYLDKKKDKINTLTDFYLSILMPVDVGKGNEPNHAVFDNEYPLKYKENGKLTDLSKSRHFGYRQNPAFFYEGKIHKNVKITRANGKKESYKELCDEKKIWFENGEKEYDGAGKTHIWEIEKSISNIYEEGKKFKAAAFSCGKKIVDTPPLSVESGTWNVVITEKYTGDKCLHLEKTQVRKNCRRGSIKVYDHNKKLVLTISDCLLEGIKGEDRMKTGADAPFGTYKINSEPFIMGSSSGKFRTTYGKNPRLAFEPIKGSGDEADKSGRSLIRIHGGRQEDEKFNPRKKPALLRTEGCIRVWDDDAKAFYDWWTEFNKLNPKVKPGKLQIIK
jgi:hypothetical protein